MWVGGGAKYRVAPTMTHYSLINKSFSQTAGFTLFGAVRGRVLGGSGKGGESENEPINGRKEMEICIQGRWTIGQWTMTAGKSVKPCLV